MVFGNWVVIACAGGIAVGFLLGVLFTRLWLNRGYGNRVNEEAQRIAIQHSATIEKLRGAYRRAQTELDQVRNAVPRQVAAAVAEQRAQVTRLEQQLKIAYIEIDRLRKWSEAAEGSDIQNGFAATKPFSPN